MSDFGEVIAEHGDRLRVVVGGLIVPADYLEARARATSAHLSEARKELAKAQHEVATIQAMVDNYEATISMYRAAADTLRGEA